MSGGLAGKALYEAAGVVAGKLDDAGRQEFMNLLDALTRPNFELAAPRRDGVRRWLRDVGWVKR